MSPKETREDFTSPEREVQSLFIVRHGDRWDYENREWAKTSPRPGDPPLSARGHRQARETGIFLNSFLQDMNEITWLSSPFLRCLQTSNEAMNALSFEDSNKLQINPEYSIFEWDGKGGEWHESLPPIEERTHYFPRLNATYESLFVPTLPEPRSEFHGRCQRTIKGLNKRFPFSPRSAIVAVSHAAGCIGLVRAATNLTFQDITPAAPCSVYRLTRSSDDDVWSIDAHDAPNSLNGHTDHMSDLLGATIPWNNFGDKSINKGYTGPSTSRFAPKDIREEL